MTFRCSACLELLPAEAFYRRKYRGKIRRRSECRTCMRLRAKRENELAKMTVRSWWIEAGSAK